MGFLFNPCRPCCKKQCYYFDFETVYGWSDNPLNAVGGGHILNKPICSGLNERHYLYFMESKFGGQHPSGGIVNDRNEDYRNGDGMLLRFWAGEGSDPDSSTYAFLRWPGLGGSMPFSYRVSGHFEPSADENVFNLEPSQMNASCSGWPDTLTVHRSMFNDCPNNCGGNPVENPPEYLRVFFPLLSDHRSEPMCSLIPLIQGSSTPIWSGEFTVLDRFGWSFIPPSSVGKTFTVVVSCTGDMTWDDTPTNQDPDTLAREDYFGQWGIDVRTPVCQTTGFYEASPVYDYRQLFPYSRYIESAVETTGVPECSNGTDFKLSFDDACITYAMCDGVATTLSWGLFFKQTIYRDYDARLGLFYGYNASLGIPLPWYGNCEWATNLNFNPLLFPAAVEDNQPQAAREFTSERYQRARMHRASGSDDWLITLEASLTNGSSSWEILDPPATVTFRCPASQFSIRDSNRFSFDSSSIPFYADSGRPLNSTDELWAIPQCHKNLNTLADTLYQNWYSLCSHVTGVPGNLSCTLESDDDTLDGKVIGLRLGQGAPGMFDVYIGTNNRMSYTGFTDLGIVPATGYDFSSSGTLENPYVDNFRYGLEVEFFGFRHFHNEEQYGLYGRLFRFDDTSSGDFEKFSTRDIWATGTRLSCDPLVVEFGGLEFEVGENFYGTLSNPQRWTTAFSGAPFKATITI